jgi:hypothetical protein
MQCAKSCEIHQLKGNLESMFQFLGTSISIFNFLPDESSKRKPSCIYADPDNPEGILLRWYYERIAKKFDDTNGHGESKLGSGKTQTQG